MEEIKALLGFSSSNYTDEQIVYCLNQAELEVKTYCNRELDEDLRNIAKRIAIIKLNRLGTEGLMSESFSGVSQNYVDGYPADIKSLLNAKRRIKVI